MLPGAECGDRVVPIEPHGIHSHRVVTTVAHAKLRSRRIWGRRGESRRDLTRSGPLDVAIAEGEIRAIAVPGRQGIARIVLGLGGERAGGVGTGPG